MTDRAPAGALPLPDDPFARLEGPLAGTVRMRLEVVENRPLTEHMQQVVLTAPELAGFGWRPGQDVMLLVAVDGSRPVRRRYTIRSTDPGQRLLTLGIVRHGGEGPGERWLREAGPGDVVEGIGPRGKIFPAAEADWHLFIGDQSALPAFFTMAGSLPAAARATVVLEVPGPRDEQELAATADVGVSWLYRDGRPAGDPGALAGAAAGVPLPPGHGHAYLAGEAKAVLALREVLDGRGVPAGQVSAKAYWGRGRANASHGEPARDG
jgi:NADPH-dependent ferric siderophore reductase